MKRDLDFGHNAESNIGIKFCVGSSFFVPAVSVSVRRWIRNDWSDRPCRFLTVVWLTVAELRMHTVWCVRFQWRLWVSRRWRRCERKELTVFPRLLQSGETINFLPRFILSVSSRHWRLGFSHRHWRKKNLLRKSAESVFRAEQLLRDQIVPRRSETWTLQRGRFRRAAVYRF